MRARRFAKVGFQHRAFRLEFIEPNSLLPSSTKSLNRSKSSRAHHSAKIVFETRVLRWLIVKPWALLRRSGMSSRKVALVNVSLCHVSAFAFDSPVTLDIRHG